MHDIIRFDIIRVVKDSSYLEKAVRGEQKIRK